MRSERGLAEAAFAYVSESAPVLSILLDHKLRIIDLNPLSRQVLSDGVIGHSIADMLAKSTPILSPGQLALERCPERLLTLKSASEISETYRFRFYPLDSGWLALGSLDFFEQQRLRREVLELNQDLGSIARELRQANRELLDLNELKNQSLGMAAHDLRKPVGLVMTYCEFVLDESGDALSQEHRDFLRTCFDSALHMKVLIDDFLDVSIIESGNLRLNRMPTSVEEILANTQGICRVLARKKKVVLSMTCAEHLPVICVDSSKVQQVLINLVGNAIEHSNSGQQIWVFADLDAASIVFSVRDQGPGIRAEDQPRLFSPFAEAGTRKTGGERSIGLGLSIARKIVQAYQGKIWLKSVPGEGSTFLFSLPLAANCNTPETE